jgi:hypothetical protein
MPLPTISTADTLMSASGIGDLLDANETTHAFGRMSLNNLPGLFTSHNTRSVNNGIDQTSLLLDYGEFCFPQIF